MIGLKFGKWTVTCENGRNKSRSKMYDVECECGNTSNVTGNSLRKRTSTQCKACSASSTKNATTHGLHWHPAYNNWKMMVARCTKSSATGYENYGGRGIKVCPEWGDVKVFIEWADTNGFVDGLTIERIDVNGNYCPSNCEWIPMAEQYSNKRELVQTNKTGHKGVSLSGRTNKPYLAKSKGKYVGRYTTIAESVSAISTYEVEARQAEGI